MAERKRGMALACALLSMLGGCAWLGPTALSGGRASYNEAIIATNSQQVLATIVRTRYGEPTGLLAVSSITSNLRIGARAGAEFGIGADSNYRGNLVPLTTGFAYEENPTISYAPVQGEKYMRQLLSPLPLDVVALLLNALRDSPQALTLLVRSVNGIRNPDFLVGPSAGVDARFTRVGELLAGLARAGAVHWVQPAEPGSGVALALLGSGDAALQSQTGELYELLGLAPRRDADGTAILPVRLGVVKPAEPALHLETRSLFELLNIAAASVEVPEEHVEEGIAPPLPPLGPAGQGLRIRRSEHRPDRAITAVRHHGGWYFIDATDTASKQTFRLLEALMAVRIADATGDSGAKPVLTVPVSR